jgi:hypothetical protein
MEISVEFMRREKMVSEHGGDFLLRLPMLKRGNATVAPTESISKPQPKKHQSANFTEAWLEFSDKRIAKTVAPMLNAQLIGGKKGDRWRDDIWTMRYLSGFKWEMLGEQVGK